MNDKKFNSSKEHFSVRELAEILGISRVAVFKKIQRGQIKAVRVGRNYIIPREAALKCTSSVFSDKLKGQIDDAVRRVLKDYGETLRLLGRE
jgi:excisionase family DNA binding protein